MARAVTHIMPHLFTIHFSAKLVRKQHAKKQHNGHHRHTEVKSLEIPEWASQGHAFHKTCLIENNLWATRKHQNPAAPRRWKPCRNLLVFSSASGMGTFRNAQIISTKVNKSTIANQPAEKNIYTAKILLVSRMHHLTNNAYAIIVKYRIATGSACGCIVCEEMTLRTQRNTKPRSKQTFRITKT